MEVNLWCKEYDFAKQCFPQISLFFSWSVNYSLLSFWSTLNPSTIIWKHRLIGVCSVVDFTSPAVRLVWDIEVTYVQYEILHLAHNKMFWYGITIGNVNLQLWRQENSKSGISHFYILHFKDGVTNCMSWCQNNTRLSVIGVRIIRQLFVCFSILDSLKLNRM